MNAARAIFAGSLLFLCAGESPAQDALRVPKPRSLPNEDSTPSFGGNASNLPAGAGASLPQVIEHARSMPAVLEALQLCADRGYVRHAEHDSGLVSSNPPISLVVLALEKPGLVCPPGYVGAPVVQVATVLDPAGIPSTQISGGLVFVDTQQQVFVPAEDVPGYAPDGTFDLTKSGGGGGSKRMIDRIVGCFRNYLVCAGLGNSACMASAILPPSWYGLARSVVCVAFNTTGCVIDFADCEGSE
jgi:hypothetical protein